MTLIERAEHTAIMLDEFAALPHVDKNVKAYLDVARDLAKGSKKIENI